MLVILQEKRSRQEVSTIISTEHVNGIWFHKAVLILVNLTKIFHMITNLILVS